MAANDILAAVAAFLKADDWKVQIDEEKNLIKGGVKLKCKLSHADMYVVANNFGYTSYAVASLKASEDAYAETSKYLHQVNYGLRSGNFELDFRDGEVRYKVYVNADGMDPIPDEIIKDSIYLPFSMLERYGDNLAAVMLGFMDADTANKKDKEKGQ